MSWPTPQDYAEAIQNPRTSFRDPDLRQARAEVTALGLPRPITGNFASVYRMAAGKTSVAVRCFFRDFSDMQTRYSAISSSLGGSRVAYTVGFTYLGDGITIRKVAYPVLKMEWAQGLLLDEFIRSHLEDPRTLTDLASAWMRMAADLSAAGIAHGDLQHGNVLCDGGQLRLVDYDGMFVPGLRGRASHELGHPNYQHPGRRSSHFGLYLDHFSQWVILTSLLALSVEPELWHELGAGDERLLFGRPDFEKPELSPTFTRLLNHPDDRVKSAASNVRQALDLKVEHVPALDFNPAPSIRRRSRRKKSSLAGTGTSSLPEWISSHVVPSRPERFADPGRRPRVCLAAIASVFAIDLVPGTQGIISGSVRGDSAVALAGAAALTVWVSYVREPGARTRLSLLTQRTRWSVVRSGNELKLSRARRRLAGLEGKLGRRSARAGDRARKRQTRQRRKVELVEDQVRCNLRGLGELIEELRAQRAEGVKEELIRYRDKATRAELRRHRLLTAELSSVGWPSKLYLWLHGIHTAADVDSNHAETLDRVGKRQAAELLGWRERLRPAKISELPSAAEARATRGFDRRIARMERTRMKTLVSAAPVLSRMKAAENAEKLSTEQRNDRLSRQAALKRGRINERWDRGAHRTAEIDRVLDSIDEALTPYERLTLPRFVGLFLLGSPKLGLFRRPRLS